MSNEINDLDIVKKHYKGKVKDIYDLGDTLLMVTSDRVSAYDVVFPDVIPNKGKILNQISIFFFNKTKHIIDNHFITDKIEEYPVELHQFKNELEDRSMLVKKNRVIPFECIVRGYITGSAWNEYIKFGTVNQFPLANNLQESQKLPETLFTPSTKADEGHDENISFHEMKNKMDQEIAEILKHKSLELYNYAHDFLYPKDILIADTKFEFGSIGNKIFLIDEIITPDSSRFWDKNNYKPGSTPKSYDKQYLRDYITNEGWNKQPPVPKLPLDIINKTYDKYYQAYKTIVGAEAKTWS